MQQEAVVVHLCVGTRRKESMPPTEQAEPVGEDPYGERHHLESLAAQAGWRIRHG